jgi:hypothetical protein
MFPGRVRLVEQDTGDPIFTFEPDEKTIYEFANAPAEVPEHDVAHDDRTGEHPEAAPDPCKNEHFHRYYSLFRDPTAEPNICFKKIVGGAPAPDPATCGAAGGGRITGPFGGG